MSNDLLYGKIKDLQRRVAVYEDEAAYKELFFILYSSLTRFSASITKSKEIAEEIVSDVFIQLWNNRQKLSEIDDLRLYLFISVKNNSVREVPEAAVIYNQAFSSVDHLTSLANVGTIKERYVP